MFPQHPVAGQGHHVLWLGARKNPGRSSDQIHLLLTKFQSKVRATRFCSAITLLFQCGDYIVITSVAPRAADIRHQVSDWRSPWQRSPHHLMAAGCSPQADWRNWVCKSRKGVHVCVSLCSNVYLYLYTYIYMIYACVCVCTQWIWFYDMYIYIFICYICYMSMRHHAPPCTVYECITMKHLWIMKNMITQLLIT